MEEVNKLLNEAETLIKWNKWNWLKAFFAWSSSRELATWSKIHEAERHAAWILSPAAVTARLKRAVGELSDLRKEKKEVWQDALKDTRSWGLDQSQATLNQFLADLYDARDSEFAILATLQNKVTWLILIGLLFIFGLQCYGYGLVLMAGGIGGLAQPLAACIN
ncbi:MAG: hypothetical protein EFT35_00770 [Methanophagales archaeon ANME-1-THS]|nr:MAG: hypothetical protein EFT35_00770 [Methanophagales archaeon ANME-1-THS]